MGAGAGGGDSSRVPQALAVHVNGGGGGGGRGGTSAGTVCDRRGVQAAAGLWAPRPRCSLDVVMCLNVITSPVRKTNEEMKPVFR